MKSLNETLIELGYMTKPSSNSKKYIIKNGVIVFEGDAKDVWKWLRQNHQIP